jgi:hypothetical protein
MVSLSQKRREALVKIRVAVVMVPMIAGTLMTANKENLFYSGLFFFSSLELRHNTFISDLGNLGSEIKCVVYVRDQDAIG